MLKLPLQLVRICWSDRMRSTSLDFSMLYQGWAAHFVSSYCLISWCPMVDMFLDFVQGNNSSLQRVALYGKKGLLLMFLQQPRVERNKFRLIASTAVYCPPQVLQRWAHHGPYGSVTHAKTRRIQLRFRPEAPWHSPASLVQGPLQPLEGLPSKLTCWHQSIYLNLFLNMFKYLLDLSSRS